MVMVGYDADKLEALCEAHWTFPYDKGEYARELMEGDIHSKNAGIFGTDRDTAKAGKYALTYGAQPHRLAETIRCPVSKAQVYFDTFWEENRALKALMDGLERHWEDQAKQGIMCQLSGWFLHSRAKHSLVNLLFQHTGAVIMDTAGSIMDDLLGGIQHSDEYGWHYLLEGKAARRVIYYHDEYQWECDPAIADKVLTLGCESVKLAGEALNLRVPLSASGSVGQSWRDTH
jgi:DNA polymerase I-like protein with 3'-5' exonuclease and polymerase domains